MGCPSDMPYIYIYICALQVKHALCLVEHAMFLVEHAMCHAMCQEEHTMYLVLCLVPRLVSFRVRGQSSPHRAMQRLSPGRARDHPVMDIVPNKALSLSLSLVLSLSSLDRVYFAVVCSIIQVCDCSIDVPCPWSAILQKKSSIHVPCP